MQPMKKSRRIHISLLAMMVSTWGIFHRIARPVASFVKLAFFNATYLFFLRIKQIRVTENELSTCKKLQAVTDKN